MKVLPVAIGCLASFCLGAVPASACQEFYDALAWSKQSTATQTFPVEAYFTSHYGYGGTYSAKSDTVMYAVGRVVHNDPLDILSGTLAVKAVTTSPYYSYRVEVAVTGPTTGQISYQVRYKGNPVGGIAAMTVVQATCVNGVLLTGTSGSAVLTVGVARKPAERRLRPPS